MKKLLHILTFSILFSCNISYATKEWLPELSVKNIFLLVSAVLVAHTIPTGLTKLKLYNGKSALWHRIKNLLWTQQEILSAVVNERKWQAEYDRSYDVTELHAACELGDEEAVRQLVQKQDVELNSHRRGTNWSNTRGGTPLHLACRKGNVSIVSLLCSQQGIKSNAQASGDMTPLHDTCQHGHIEVVQELLRYSSVDINIKNSDGLAAVDVAYSCTQGYFARFSQHENIVALLLAQENIDPTGMLALACRYNDRSTFDKMLKHKNCVRYLKNNFALYEACAAGNVAMVRVLLTLNIDNCMDINKLRSLYNPLHIACKKGSETGDKKYIEIVTMLLADQAINIFQEADDSCVHVKAKYKNTAFTLAVSLPEIVQLLLTKDKSCPRKESQQYWSGVAKPLYSAINQGSLISVKLFLEHGAKIFERDSDGYDAFEYACWQACKNTEDVYLKIVEALLPPEEGSSPIYFSGCLYKAINTFSGYRAPRNTKIVEFLLRCGADLNAQIKPPYKYSPPSIMFAAAENSLPCLNLLMQKGGDCSPQNFAGRTVLLEAFWQETIKDFNEVHCLKKIDGNKKREIAIKELGVIAHCASTLILGWHDKMYRLEVEARMKRVNDFATMCFRYGNIDSKATTYNHLLARAYQQAAQIKPGEYAVDTDERYHHDTISRHKLKDVIVHALLRHMPAETPEQKIDKAIAIAYEKNPLDYCLMKESEKQAIRKHLGQQGFGQNTQNYQLPCVIF